MLPRLVVFEGVPPLFTLRPKKPIPGEASASHSAMEVSSCATRFWPISLFFCFHPGQNFGKARFGASPLSRARSSHSHFKAADLLLGLIHRQPRPFPAVAGRFNFRFAARSGRGSPVSQVMEVFPQPSSHEIRVFA